MASSREGHEDVGDVDTRPFVDVVSAVVQEDVIVMRVVVPRRDGFCLVATGGG